MKQTVTMASFLEFMLREANKDQNMMRPRSPIPPTLESCGAWCMHLQLLQWRVLIWRQATLPCRADDKSSKNRLDGD